MGRPRPACLGPVVGLLLLAAGCGYRLAGSQGVAGGAPRDLWIAPVVDEGGEPLFGALLAQALARQVTDRGDVAVARRGEATADLAVRVEWVSESGVAYRAGDLVREYELAASVTATLTGPGGEPIWKSRGIRAAREFRAGATVEETEANKDQARSLLTRDLAREVLRRVSLALEGVAG